MNKMNVTMKGDFHNSKALSRGRERGGKIRAEEVFGETLPLRSCASRQFKMDCDLLVGVFPPLATVACNHLCVMIGSFDCLLLFMLVKVVIVTTD